MRDCLQRPFALFRVEEAMINVIMDKRPLGIRDGAFDCVKLLREFDAFAPALDHRDH